MMQQARNWMAGSRCRTAAATLAAAAALAAGAPAIADEARTAGGIQIASEDGEFQFQLGGRIHFDAYAFDDGEQASTTDTTEFRRARLTLTGSLYGWDYKLEQDFAAGNTTAGFREVWIGRKAAGGTWTIGQFKPYRSMEELTSSNEITMLERPFSSATGLYSGRQFQQGLGYKRSGDHYTAGISVFNLRDAAGPRNEGTGAAARLTFAPVAEEGRTLHVGLSYSLEDANDGTDTAAAVANYAGRRGPAITLASRPGSSGDTVTALGAELAFQAGPVVLQSEYAQADYGQGSDARDLGVTTYYLQASWMLTGESKPYNAGSGVFRSARAAGARGAWELTARYDTIENDDISGLEATTTAVGINYYATRALRFMLNYTMGEGSHLHVDEETGAVLLLDDDTNQIALRAQLAF